MINTMPINISISALLPITPGKDDSQPHLTDTTLAGYNPVDKTIDLYRRNTDKSWTKIDRFEIDSTQISATRIVWNGDDSVIVIDGPYYDWDLFSYGRVVVYVKDNGNWSVQSITPYATIGSNQGAVVGSTVLLNKRSLIIGVPGSQGGEAYLLQRNISGVWQFTAVITSGPVSAKYFAVSVMKNDYDIIFQSANGAWLDVETAFVKLDWCLLPLSVDPTCQNVTLATCDTLQEIFIQDLYTVNLMAKCDFNPFVHREKISREEIWIEVGFQRDSAETVYCSASYLCPTQTVPVGEPITCLPPISNDSSPLGHGTPNRNNTSIGFSNSYGVLEHISLFMAAVSLLLL